MKKLKLLFAVIIIHSSSLIINCSAQQQPISFDQSLKELDQMLKESYAQREAWFNVENKEVLTNKKLIDPNGDPNDRANFVIDTIIVTTTPEMKRNDPGQYLGSIINTVLPQYEKMKKIMDDLNKRTREMDAKVRLEYDRLKKLFDGILLPEKSKRLDDKNYR